MNDPTHPTPASPPAAARGLSEAFQRQAAYVAHWEAVYAAAAVSGDARARNEAKLRLFPFRYGAPRGVGA